MNSQSGLVTLWTQGDAVTRAVALLLLAMSLASWVIILIKALNLRQITVQARATEKFWQARDFAEGPA
jgi:biopolymer transport protein ExbB